MTGYENAELSAEYAAQTEEIARAYCDWDRTAFDRWLERVKREAGAAALREFAEWWDAPGTIREFHMPSTRARSMAERIERGE